MEAQNPEVTLEWAATNGDLEVIKNILKQVRLRTHYAGSGVDVQGVTVGKKRVKDVINLAVKNGHINIVEYLLATWGHMCAVDAMYLAARYGHLDIVKFLCSKNTRCTSDVMIIAASNGYLEILKCLHENGNKCHLRAMEYAVANGYFDIVHYLLEVVHLDCTGMSMASNNEFPEIVEYVTKNVKNIKYFYCIKPNNLHQ